MIGAMRMRKSVFASPADYLNPNHLPPVPLVELPARLVPFPPGEHVRILAQLAFAWPLGNLKHPAVFNMLDEAMSGGLLEGIHTAVESSSGNTLYCLANLAPAFGIRRVVGIVPSDIPKTKEWRLREMGAEVRKNYERPGQPSAIEEARDLGRQQGWFHLAQYENTGNWRGHMRYTVQPVWEQLGEELSVYGVGLGTTGTGIAAREIFKNTPVRVVGAICAPGNPVPGVRTRDRLQPHFDWQNGIYPVEIEQHEAYRGSLELVSAQIRGGPSSGFARAGVNRFLLDQYQNRETWETLRNKNGEIVVVFVCGDSFDLYDIDKYRTVLDPNEFPDQLNYQI
jgi:cysteine synthase